MSPRPILNKLSCRRFVNKRYFIFIVNGQSFIDPLTMLSFWTEVLQEEHEVQIILMSVIYLKSSLNFYKTPLQYNYSIKFVTSLKVCGSEFYKKKVFVGYGKVFRRFNLMFSVLHLNLYILFNCCLATPVVCKRYYMSLKNPINTISDLWL